MCSCVREHVQTRVAVGQKGTTMVCVATAEPVVTKAVVVVACARVTLRVVVPDLSGVKTLRTVSIYSDKMLQSVIRTTR
jgi:hypothetical protein